MYEKVKLRTKEGGQYEEFGRATTKTLTKERRAEVLNTRLSKTNPAQQLKQDGKEATYWEGRAGGGIGGGRVKLPGQMAVWN